MNLEDWKKLRYFKETEDWGNPAQMSADLLTILDLARSYIGLPFRVTSGTQGVHSAGSLHYSGTAVDFLVGGEKPLVDVLLDLLRFGFTGVGVYPHWGDGVGGFHVEHNTNAEHRSLWMGVKDAALGQVYIQLTAHNLLKYGCLNLRGKE